ncbi:siderophore-interacting protein [Nocardioides korecus]
MSAPRSSTGAWVGSVRAAVDSAPSAAVLCGSPVEPVEPVAGPAALVADVEVVGVERLSPSFVRVALGGPALVDLGEDGFDTRFKLVLPGPSEVLPAIPERVEDYWGAVQGLPVGVRPAVRTYTVRDVLRTPGGTRLVVDLVVHDDQPGHPAGPACRWALTARPGDRLQVVVPHRDGTYGGTEFDPAGRRRLLLVGDATAVPAVARILTDLPPGHHGEVFLEVADEADLATLPPHPDLRVHRSVTAGGPGRQLVQDVRRHLGLTAATTTPVVEGRLPVAPADVWETPRFSAAGEALTPGPGVVVPPGGGRGLDDVYAWIAGESWMVRTLRRSLVGELGLDRAQVAFMGYWRDGVAMR